MISLSNGTMSLTLSPDLLWSDEYDWSSVQQSVERSVTGALLVDIGAMLGGRPVTLQPEDDSSAWMDRGTLDTLRNWAEGAGSTFTLTIHGTARTVLFRHHDRAIEARPVVHYADINSTDWYLVTLRFMETA